MDKGVCLYHRDLDGQCAAAIVDRAASQLTTPLEFIDIDYREDVPIDVLRASDLIVIVDFSLDPDLCVALIDGYGPDIIWIDHHQTAIEKYADFPFEISGIRTEDEAACVLTWKHFFPDEPVPKAVQLVGDRDAWIWEWGAMTRKFTAALDARDTHPLNEGLWGGLLDGCGSDNHLFDTLLNEGEAIVRYRTQYWKEYRESWAFERYLNGYVMLCMNLARSGSEVFGIAEDKYDILCSFGYNGDSWTLSWYSKALDVSALAEHFGGGGHPGAAGAVLDEFPFQEKEIEIDCEIREQ